MRHTQIRRAQTAPRNLIWKLTLIICAALTIAGCSSSPSRPSKAPSNLKFDNPQNQQPQQIALSNHYKAWVNTPYKLGGLSKAGIDCSGFVQVTYRNVFKKRLPRSTELLAKKGKHITQKSLRFGDLVFFKTGRSKRHVGIYTGKGNFIHASSSRGVMQSSLKSPYWSQHYWKSQRIL